MELALSLGASGGDPSKSFPPFLDKLAPKLSSSTHDLGFCMGLGNGVTSDPPRLSLRLPCHHLPHNETGTTTQGSGKGFDVNRLSDEAEEGAALSSSPNSAMSSFQVDFGLRNGRGSDDDDNGSSRKKLRLSREQSAFLEESFKQHNTLNPKQKLALAKQLNLRPRQVEVWFQNRRARTKLKQTEVDCEYLKRCCETLTEENKRLQKEVQELRVLKASQPFYMHSPATTLTMCPSCERVATTTSTTVAATATADGKNGILSLIKTSG